MKRRKSIGCPAIALGLCLAGVPHEAAAQTAANVLLVVNDNTPTGEPIARRYAQRRGLPSSNVCHVATADDETIPRTNYARTIEQPIWECISKLGGQDRILYIVLTKGIPLRIEGTGERTGTVASVDSELTLLYRRRAGRNAGTAGFIANPYFAGSDPQTAWRPFSHQNHDIYLVTRLDGYTVGDALALVDRGAAPVRQGRIVLDGRAGSSDDAGNRWLRRAAERLQAGGLGNRVIFDETSRVLTKEAQVLGYYSWGTNDKAIRIRHFELQFVPGALAGMYVSSDGRTMKEPPPQWRPREWEDRDSYFAGSPQSLVGDLIRDGITGAAAHVNEPYLDATIRPDILFPAYVGGMNLAESFYLAMPYLSWQTIVIGDPLCAPFREQAIDETDLNPALDPAIELPARFGARRLSTIDARLKLDARQAYARYEARAARGDRSAREALLASIASEPTFIGARLSLAAVFEQDNNLDKAIEQYRAILSYAPGDVISLNNLAYHLAVDKESPAEALPFAERAVAASRDDPTMLDTLAWVLHLLGRDAEALPSIASASSGAPDNPEIRWHFAVILTALRDLPRARQELGAFLKLAPSAAERGDVQRLRLRLSER